MTVALTFQRLDAQKIAVCQINSDQQARAKLLRDQRKSNLWRKILNGAGQSKLKE